MSLIPIITLALALVLLIAGFLKKDRRLKIAGFILLGIWILEMVALTMILGGMDG